MVAFARKENKHVYSNDTAVLGVSTAAVPTVAGMVIWPNLIVIILSGIFAVLLTLFFVFKFRNRNR